MKSDTRFNKKITAKVWCADGEALFRQKYLQIISFFVCADLEIATGTF